MDVGGAVALDVLAPGLPVVGVLAPGAAVAGVLVVGALVLGAAVAVVRGVVAAGAAVTVLVTAIELEPELPVSFTSAAASTPSDSAMTLASTAIGIFQLGVAAKRVRAAAPQFRHHSCSGCSGAPHSGQASLAVARVGAAGGGLPDAG